MELTLEDAFLPEAGCRREGPRCSLRPARSPTHVDHYRCRFIIKESPGDLSDNNVHPAPGGRSASEHRWMHIEKLQEFDGELGFTWDQGEN